MPAAAAALALAAWWAVAAARRRAIAADLEAIWRGLERQATRAIAICALTAAITAAVFATRSASGADASGYLSQAAMWSRGNLTHVEPLDENGLADRGEWLTTPLGWRPASPGHQVPTYAPGLPLLMAVPHAVAGIDGATAVVTASAAIAIWATGMLVGGVAGIVTAFVIATTPVFIYQSVQPMSDVPVTAAWMLGFLLLAHGRRDAWAGIACAVAVLIRPNLAPLAIVPLLVAGNRVAFAAPVALAGAALALLQWSWYGSPLRSGYGTAGELFALAHVIPNADRYAGWLVATSPVLLLAPFGLARAWPDQHARALAAFAALVAAAYLVYAVFDHWSYLRFVLPALAVMAVLTGVAVAWGVGKCPAAVRAPLLFVVVLAIAAHGVWTARSLDAFRLSDQLQRVELAAHYLQSDLPEGAVILSGEQSGAMRYHTGRSILRWDLATPEQLSDAMRALALAERPLYIALDVWEEPLFREKFRGVPGGELDWPPMLDAGTTHRTRVWRLADRAPFLDGTHIGTLRLANFN